MHRFYLLFPLRPGVIKSFVLLFDALRLASDLLLPRLLGGILPLLVLSFEFSDLFKLCLFLNFKNGLLHCLCEEDIENWLDLFVIVKEIIVSDLGDFVDSCLFWHVLGSWGLWQEYVSLSLNSHFLRRCASLLSQEVRQINFDPRRGTGAQIVGGCLLFLFFEF